MASIERRIHPLDTVEELHPLDTLLIDPLHVGFGILSCCRGIEASVWGTGRRSLGNQNGPPPSRRWVTCYGQLPSLAWPPGASTAGQTRFSLRSNLHPSNFFVND